MFENTPKIRCRIDCWKIHHISAFNLTGMKESFPISMENMHTQNIKYNSCTFIRALDDENFVHREKSK